MKHLPTLCSLLAALLLPLLLAGCDHSFLFDREGYCPEPEPEPEPVPAAPTYWAQFVYDYNMDYADLFAAQVSDITLYVADSAGTIVWQSHATAPAITAEGYAMELPVDPGTYSLLLWGGTTDAGTFAVPTSATTLGELTATMARRYDGDSAYSATDLDRWFYAYLPNETFPSAAGSYTYTMSLTKDTNIFHISLTDDEGYDLDPAAFTVTISAANGDLAWDNSLASDAETITYYPWATRGSTLTADLTTSRLVLGSSQQLKVYYNDEEIISLPLIDDLLLIKDNYTQEMDNQEFLDREDEWSLAFTIAHEGGEEEDKYYWLPAVIYINSWRVVLQEHGL